MPLIDLSSTIRADPPELPEPLRTEIDYRDHAAGAAMIEALFGVPPALLRDREGWTTETFLRFGTHNSTHVDAPYHYNSTIQGQPAQTIDELPLDWFFGAGLVVDVADHEDGQAVTVATLEERLARAPRERDIVLVHTGRDAFVEDLDYVARGPGVTAAATRWLFEHGVRVMGIDAWGWDQPLHIQAEAAKAAGEPGIFWAAHQVDLPYAQIERLVNLAALPADGFQVACFPLKIERASAAPARVVAIVGD